MKITIICEHLFADDSLPCIQIINEPCGNRDTGETYLCLDVCAEIDPPWAIPNESLRTVCDDCGKSLAIVKTYDCREGVTP